MCKKIFLNFLFLMIFSTISSYAQCAMCKAVVENGDVDMAEGVNNGISYLMVFPYLLVGVLFFTLYRYRKNQIKN
ncbi:hypothetical protein K8354_11720 [Polaribacter litorisediminis]|nr:hypothetical protein K8354_11720 [Polaribacter litorisediminis]